MIETLAVGFVGGVLGAAAAKWLAGAIERNRYRQTVRRRLDEVADEALVGRHLW